MTTPYAPPLLAQAIYNPSVGAFGQPVAYISPSQWEYAPTGIDASNLVEEGSGQSQTQALYDLIASASDWADRICMGADASAKGASLCATMSVEQMMVKQLQGELRLICDYKPVIAVTGLSLGSGPGNLQGVTPAVAQAIWVNGKIIHVPMYLVSGSFSSTSLVGSPVNWRGQVYAVWSYVNGYPHTYLTANASKGAVSLTLFPTGPSNTLYGLFAGSQMTIVDGVNTETVTLTATPTTNVVACTATANAHTVPVAPDFLPVTCLPADVRRAVIYLVNTLIKSRGDGGFEISEEGEPTQTKAGEANDATRDLAMALDLLEPFRIAVKQKT